MQVLQSILMYVSRVLSMQTLSNFIRDTKPDQKAPITTNTALSLVEGMAAKAVERNPTRTPYEGSTVIPRLRSPFVGLVSDTPILISQIPDMTGSPSFDVGHHKHIAHADGLTPSLGASPHASQDALL